MSLDLEVYNISLIHIKSFLAVAKFMNFTRAAEFLYLSQSTLSRNISFLESTLGVPLFERKKSGRSVKLTQGGEELLRLLPKSMDALEAAIMSARAASVGGRGILRIGFVPYIASSLLIRSVRAFREACPDVRIILSDGSGTSVSEALQSGKIDVGFFSSTRASLLPGGQQMTIYRGHHSLVVSKDHPLAGREKVSVSELRDETFIVSSESPTSEYFSKEMFGSLWQLCGEHGFTPHIYRCDNISGLLTMVGCNMGVAMLANPACEWIPEGVCLLKFDDPTPEYEMSAAWEVTNENSCLPKFIKALENIAPPERKDSF